jgi:predicted CoA-binding protein
MEEAETRKYFTMKPKDSPEHIIRSILEESKRIAVVGLSDKESRDSHRVARYLIEQGYEVVPVNPTIHETLGLRSFPDLASVPGPIDVVNIFRRLEHIPSIVDDAIRIGAKSIWTQYGLTDQASARRARQAGLLVVMDRCIKVEHMQHMD